VIVNDVRLEPDFSSLLPQTRCQISVPLLAGEEVLGVLSVQDNQPNRFSQADLDTFNTLAGQLAIALHNATLFAERKRADKALQTSEEKYRRLIETMNEGLGMQDEKGLITYVNDSLCTIWGFSRDEMIGRPITDFLDEANLRIFKKRMAEGREGKHDSYELEWLGKDKRKISTIVSLQALLDDEGNFSGAFAVITDITERKRASEQIKASLHEKEVLLKEIHHRVKNNLQIISSLLYLQSENIEDKATQEMFKESQNRVKSMALIHEELYQSHDLAHIDLAAYIERLTNHLLRSWGANKISLQLKIDTLFLTIETAIPCGLIINELVTNAMKYAFPAGGEGGQILVQMQAGEDNQLRLSVKDNGVGFPKEVNFRRPRSLGLTLVTTLVKQLKGTIELLCSDGTEFIIRFNDSTS
jgi:PAS domain S-box-containing protein